MVNRCVLRSAGQVFRIPSEHVRRGWVNECDSAVHAKPMYTLADRFENGFNQPVRSVGIRPEIGWKR